MIDASQIMPLNFFMYKGVYSGEHHGMRYRIKKVGEKPDEVLEAYVWQKPYSFAATPKEEIISDTFPLSEEGRLQLVDWLKQMYEKDKERWESAPTILEAPIKKMYIMQAVTAPPKRGIKPETSLLIYL